MLKTQNEQISEMEKVAKERVDREFQLMYKKDTEIETMKE